jgi:predicted Zn finger-like uncharacterized protein
MIIVCPACETRYDLPESAIGPEGRTVRCAQCRHSWLQLGPESAEATEPLEAAAPLSTETDVPAQNADTAEITAPPAPTAPIPPAAPPVDPLVASLAFNLWEADEPAPPRKRNKAWLWLLALFLLLAAAIGAALTLYGSPDWLPIHNTAMRTSPAGLALDFPPSMIERKTLADGTEFFGARGTVTNTGSTRRRVPPIEIVLRNPAKHVVFRWEVVPPKSQLGPGESMTIKEAVTDIPRDATLPEIGWKAG